MTCLIAGTISVKSVLEVGHRKIDRLIVNPKKRTREIAYLISLAKRQNIPVEERDRQEMMEMAPNNGGVILEIEPREIPPLTCGHPLDGLSVYISGVEDPYNMGSIARGLYAAGASRMIIQKRDWTSALSVLIRASAGAWEKLEILSIERDEDLIEAAESVDREIWSAARDDGAESLFDVALPENCLIAIGGAMRGLSSRILYASDRHLYIPYGREFRNSLDSVTATAVFAFEWTRHNLKSSEE